MPNAAGLLSDLYGRKTIIFIGLVIMIIGSLVAAFFRFRLGPDYRPCPAGYRRCRQHHYGLSGRSHH